MHSGESGTPAWRRYAIQPAGAARPATANATRLTRNVRCLFLRPPSSTPASVGAQCMVSHRLKTASITGVKLCVSAALLAYLVSQARQNDAFAELRGGSKNWTCLGTAGVCVLTGVLLTMVRWYYLVRALGMPFTMLDALRLGFLGYLLNFVALGSVGGDLFKAVFLAREQHGHRPEAVASVVVDRLVGLYALFFMASIGVLWTGALRPESPRPIAIMAWAALSGTALCTAAMVATAMMGQRLRRMIAREPAPRAAHEISLRVVDATIVYRKKYGVVILAFVLSLGVHAFMSTGFYFIAQGLPGPSVSLGTHFMIVPLSMLAGVLPLPLAGLGALETALEFFYQWSLAGRTAVQGRGLVLALTYRLITVAVAAVGAAIYALSRRDVEAALREASSVALEGPSENESTDWK